MDKTLDIFLVSLQIFVRLFPDMTRATTSDISRAISTSVYRSHPSHRRKAIMRLGTGLDPAGTCANGAGGSIHSIVVIVQATETISIVSWS